MKTRMLTAGMMILAQVTLGVCDLSGQAAMTDEGEFVVEREGVAFATEAFTIRSSGFGANQRLLARGTLEMNGDVGRTTTVSALLTEGPARAILVYELTTTGAEDRRMEMKASGERFRAEISTASRTQERELRARIGGQSVVVLDPLLPHLYYFLGRLAESNAETALSVIAPRELVQTSATLSVVGTERLQIGQSTLVTQHLRLTVDNVAHHVWIDLQNRVLRVEIPAQGLRAIRRSPPGN